ncbi:MAG: hypothetical protein QXL01_00955 [Thermoplasmatales archaeon]
MKITERIMVEELLETVVKELENRNFEKAAVMLEEIVNRTLQMLGH